MKHLLIALILTTTMAYADDSKKEENLDQRKSHVLGNIDKRISLLNSLKGCVSSATDKEALKVCRKTHKEAMKALQGENKEWKEDRKEAKEEKKKTRQEKKAKKDK